MPSAGRSVRSPSGPEPHARRGPSGPPCHTLLRQWPHGPRRRTVARRCVPAAALRRELALPPPPRRRHRAAADDRPARALDRDGRPPGRRRCRLSTSLAGRARALRARAGRPAGAPPRDRSGLGPGLAARGARSSRPPFARGLGGEGRSRADRARSRRPGPLHPRRALGRTTRLPRGAGGRRSRLDRPSSRADVELVRPRDARRPPGAPGPAPGAAEGDPSSRRRVRGRVARHGRSRRPDARANPRAARQGRVHAVPLRGRRVHAEGVRAHGSSLDRPHDAGRARHPLRRTRHRPRRDRQSVREMLVEVPVLLARLAQHCQG